MTPAALAAAARGDMANALVASTPGGIEAQEAAGQATFCAAATLPKECPREALEKLGVKFGKDYDDLFVSVTLPPGWKKQATDHSMHSDLVDDKGRKRGSIFYKAAFYDRSAHMYLTRRYGVDSFIRCDAAGKPTGEDYLTQPKNFLVAVMDGKEIIHSVGVVDADNGYHTRQQFEEDARKWLTEHFPEWESAAAYWD